MRLDSRGFNLIELMVVLAVLAALYAIAIPNWFDMKNRAFEAGTEANMYDFQIAVIHYSVDHGGLYPTPADDAEIKAGMKGGVYPENPFTDAQEAWVWGVPGGPPGTIGSEPAPGGYMFGYRIWGMGHTSQLPLILQSE